MAGSALQHRRSDCKADLVVLDPLKQSPDSNSELKVARISEDNVLSLGHSQTSMTSKNARSSVTPVAKDSPTSLPANVSSQL